MSTEPENPSKQIAALQAELEAVKRREAEFRANMVQEFLDHGERNSYIHVLREERAALVRREQESFRDLEELTRKLEAAGERTVSLEAELARIRDSLSWRLTAPLRALRGAPAPDAAAPARPSEYAPVEGAPFTYYLHTSPFRIYRSGTFRLRGWAWPQDGRAVTGVRVNLGGKVFTGRHGIEEPEVIARYGPQAANPRPGFEVTFETPPGRHSLSLEAQIAGTEWRWIMRTTIWCEPEAT
jgi:hypothetical protein